MAVEFRPLKATCVLVSLACPISSDVFLHAKHSEEPLEHRQFLMLEESRLNIDRKKPAPWGGVSYLLCSLIEPRGLEEGGPLTHGS